MITAIFFVLSLICNAIFGVGFFIVWKRYWSLTDAVDDVIQKISYHNSALQNLSKRDILSNDSTVIAFVKHMSAITTLIDAIVKNNASENISDEDSEANETEI